MPPQHAAGTGKPGPDASRASATPDVAADLRRMIAGIDVTRHPGQGDLSPFSGLSTRRVTAVPGSSEHPLPAPPPPPPLSKIIRGAGHGMPGCVFPGTRRTMWFRPAIRFWEALSSGLRRFSLDEEARASRSLAFGVCRKLAVSCSYAAGSSPCASSVDAAPRSGYWQMRENLCRAACFGHHRHRLGPRSNDLNSGRALGRCWKACLYAVIGVQRHPPTEQPPLLRATSEEEPETRIQPPDERIAAPPVENSGGNSEITTSAPTANTPREAGHDAQLASFRR